MAPFYGVFLPNGRLKLLNEACSSIALPKAAGFAWPVDIYKTGL